MPAFSGALADPKIKTLPKHSAAKVRHNQKEKPKISRKDLRKVEQDRKNPKKRKQELERRQALEQQLSSDAAAGDQQPPPAKKMKRRPDKPATKAQRKDEKENKAFENMVNQYKNKFASNQQVLKKWFDTWFLFYYRDLIFFHILAE